MKTQIKTKSPIIPTRLGPAIPFNSFPLFSTFMEPIIPTKAPIIPTKN